MMIKPLALATVALMLTPMSLLTRRSMAAAGTRALPDGDRPAALSPLEPCDFHPNKKTSYEAECGNLTVPENWDDPDSRLISLPVVRIPASGTNPAEPIFWLQGGPGTPNLTWAPPAWLLEKHDVVEVGYRGAEGSVVLNCPETSAIVKSYLGRGILGDQAHSNMAESVRKCADDHRAAGVDISGYKVSGVIQDMEAVRSALGYDRIHLYSVSYGTRVAQLYAYLHPDSLHRVVMIGLNTPGHFIYDRGAIDNMIRRMSDLCTNDPECSGRTDGLAQTIHGVTHNMPDRWLFLPIDADTVRMGTHMMFFASDNMSMAVDMYLAAGQGDYSGLAMMTLMAKYVFPPFTWGDLFNKGGSLDLSFYPGLDGIALGDSIIGSPLSELIWPMAAEWPLEMEDEELLRLHESDVDMLIANGTLDFSTPPIALDEAEPYWHNAQFVLLPEFSHVGDVETLQPGAFERLITSYYDTGRADASLFVYQPVSFRPAISLELMAKMLVAAMLVFPLLLIAGSVVFFRRRRSRRRGQIASRDPAASEPSRRERNA